MAVVHNGPPAPQGTSGGPDPTHADLLFKEAKQRERRRRLLWLGVAVIVLGGVVATVAVTTSRSETSPPAKVSTPNGSEPTDLPIGSIGSLTEAGPLAVGPTGALYVADPTRHEVLVRLADGRFGVVAGNGRTGFAGDGGPATRAELSVVSAMAFAPDGDLYLADGSRVRVVNREGTIRTIAGDGRSGSVSDASPALSAPLGPVTSIAFSPVGQLYMATSARLFRLTPGGRLDSVPAVLPPGRHVQAPGSLDGFGSIAVDADGDVYASSLFDGWSVFRISPGGVATYLGYARRSGGSTAIVQRGADGVIEVDDGQDILRVEGNHLVTALAVDKVSGIDTFIFTSYFTLAPDGTLLADNLGPPAFEPFQQIVSIVDGRGTSLWRGAPGR